MKMSDVFILVAVFFALFSVVILAYGFGLLFENVQIALVFGVGVAVFLVAVYFYKRGKCSAKDETLMRLEDLSKNN